MNVIKYLIVVLFIQVINVSFYIVSLYFGRFIMEMDELLFNVISKYIIFSGFILYFIYLPIVISNRYIKFIEENNDMKN
tara:strand:- start:2656 stop:2892 length:237 start_codon:yes stop_codon:yes gene_type:complete